MWFEKSVIYQIYTLGFCNALESGRDGTVNRISKIAEWIPHIRDLGADTIFLNPIFDSDYHGYDTRDYTKIDGRLGLNSDFTDLCKTIHDNDMKIVIDGVFNHVGRGFWAFKHIQQHRESSPYCSWFNIDFGGNSTYNDGFWYEGWEGHYDLIKLNLQNGEVVDYLLSCVKKWIDEFNIDGIRLDVAYMLDRNFLIRLSDFVKSINPEFFLMGEIIHGDYNQLLVDSKLDSCTNYECYHGLYSSFNSKNMFEIAYSLNRQFGPEDWTLYKGKFLTNFLDNHDVNRLGSVINNKDHLPLVYGVMFSMPGIPCIYYGSEWGAEGLIQDRNDLQLRPYFEKPINNELTEAISVYSRLHSKQEAFIYGKYEQIVVTNDQLIFLREYNDDRIFVAVNADENSITLQSDKLNFNAADLLSGEQKTFNGEMELPGMSIAYWKAK